MNSNLRASTCGMVRSCWENVPPHDVVECGVNELSNNNELLESWRSSVWLSFGQWNVTKTHGWFQQEQTNHDDSWFASKTPQFATIPISIWTSMIKIAKATLFIRRGSLKNVKNGRGKLGATSLSTHTRLKKVFRHTRKFWRISNLKINERGFKIWQLFFLQAPNFSTKNILPTFRNDIFRANALKNQKHHYVASNFPSTQCRLLKASHLMLCYLKHPDLASIQIWHWRKTLHWITQA